jgi:hypothetical protein
MCADPNLDEGKKQAYAKFISDKVAAREAFTAYNITQAVRQAGNAVEHYKYKEVVHDIFAAGDMSDYLRSGVQFNQGPAFLYHPPEVDPAAWAASGGKLTGKAPAAASLPAPVAASGEEDEEDNDNEPDDEAEEEVANVSRAATPASAATSATSATGFPAPKPTIRKATGKVLYVPAPMGRHIGLKPSGSALVNVDKTKQEIRIGNKQGTKIHVDPRANVRLNIDLLKQAGVSRTVRIAVEDGEIVITKALAN